MRAREFSRFVFIIFTLITFCRYEEIYYMSGRAAQDADAVRRIEVEVEIATRRQMHLDRFRSLKGPTNIEFTPQTFMRVRFTRECVTAQSFNMSR